MATLAELTEQLDAALKRTPVGGHSLKLDVLGEGVIHAAGEGATNADAPADCTLRITKADLDGLLAGEIDPSVATKDGRLEVIGDPMAAMAMQPVLVAAWFSGNA